MDLAQEFPWIEVGAVDPGAPQGFVRNRMVHPEDLPRWRDRYDNRGVYCTAYRYRSEDRKGDLHGNLYFDFDSKEDYGQVRADAIRMLVILEALFSIKPEDVWIFFSGMKGIHIIVPAAVLGIGPHPHLNEIFKYIATSLGSQLANKTLDPRVYDRVRLFRLPNSEHNKSGLYKVPLSFDELVSLSQDEIRALATAPRKWGRENPRYNTKASVTYQAYVKQWEASKIARKFNQNRGDKKLDFTPPCVKYLLQNGAKDGFRNNTAAVLANHFKQRGYSEDHTMEAMRRWNEKRVAPMIEDAELQTTVRSIFTRDYYYGCTTLETLAPCDKAACKFGKYKST